MKLQTKTRLLLFLAIVLACTAHAWAQASWQSGRILKVDQSVESKPLYWIANTPVTKDETNYTVAVSIGENVLVGAYTLDKSHSAPPEEWVRNRPVKVQLDGDSMFLQLVGGGDVRMRIVKRKHGPAMQPVTDAEMKEAYAPPPQAERLIGFVNPEKENADSKANAPSTPSATPDAEPAKGESQVTAGPRGVIDVTTVPYLSEIYIDGKSLGYSPAKLTLPAGKYVMRVQKDGYQPWSKEINVLDSSEFTVYAELKKK